MVYTVDIFAPWILNLISSNIADDVFWEWISCPRSLPLNDFIKFQIIYDFSIAKTIRFMIK